MFLVLAIEVKSLPKSVFMIGASGLKRLYDILEKKAYPHTKPLEKSILCRSLDQTMKEIGAEQVQQIRQESLSVEIYTVNEMRARQFLFIFSSRDISRTCSSIAVSIYSLY